MKRRNVVILSFAAFLLIGVFFPQSANAKKMFNEYNTYLLEIDRSCENDSDCAIKDVHNCCGYYPECVNVKATVDPERVKKSCADQGIASICGFPSISACQCTEHTCSPVAGAGPVAQ